MLEEARSNPDLFIGALGGQINEEVLPEAMTVVKYFRNTIKFKNVKNRKLDLGLEIMKDLGNLYTGSLPAWIAAGLEDALGKKEDLSGKIFLTLGYGSGDAAEAMLIRVVEGWKERAEKIGFARSLDGAVDLTQEEYEALHDCLDSPCPPCRTSGHFVVNHIGDHSNGFEDLGIEYYDYIPPEFDGDTDSDSLLAPPPKAVSGVMAR
jgi:hydroxymethylglutaryl-CoA synthase